MSKEDKDIEDIREAFKKLEDLQKKVDYYKGLNETITPDMSVDWAKENMLNDKKDNE